MKIYEKPEVTIIEIIKPTTFTESQNDGDDDDDIIHGPFIPFL